MQLACQAPASDGLLIIVDASLVSLINGSSYNFENLSSGDDNQQQLASAYHRRSWRTNYSSVNLKRAAESGLNALCLAASLVVMFS